MIYSLLRSRWQRQRSKTLFFVTALFLKPPLYLRYHKRQFFLYFKLSMASKPQITSSDKQTAQVSIPPHSLEAEQAVLGGLC
ncbi:replicative DNA helicase [Rodentibacter pneumotropicus]|uniref:Replicative DNA helicase n=1 Tax=Rodentibacter pneumotropicus TaxID=758 RepID=A0A3S4UP84_9PAST|nr:replicative DNA helicase [Rodentibacter pneumotropicus]